MASGSPTNASPVLSGSLASLAAGSENVSYVVSASDLLAGYTDPDGDPLSVVGLSASSGTVTNNGNGTWTITPASGFNGTVTLLYNVSDGIGGSIGAQQSFQVVANTPPALTGGKAVLASGVEDTSYTLSASDLLVGYTDADGDALSVSALSAANGTVVNNGNGTFTITPAANFNGSMALSYSVVCTATQSWTARV